MSDLFRLIWCALIGIFRPRAALQAEILVLRHQLIVLRRKSPNLLALEIATTRRPAKDTGGHSPAHSRHECREPALGSATDPRRTAQAWHRCRADHRGKIHGEEKAPAVAGLEDFSAQSCRRHRVDGFVRSPDDLV